MRFITHYAEVRLCKRSLNFAVNVTSHARNWEYNSSMKVNYKKPRHVCDMALLDSTIKEQRNPAVYALVASTQGSVKSSDFRKTAQHRKLFD